jgi:hypothetical protein
LLPSAEVDFIADDRLKKGAVGYDNSSQLLIAQMRTMATSRAVAWGADVCWSLDSDVLPPANALNCMLDILSFDNGYYGVAACPYPSQGGGAFLCGRGTQQHAILPCFSEEEKDIPKKLIEKREGLRKKIDKLKRPPSSDLLGQLKDLDKQIEAVPPKCNVFELNGEKWRKRGWFDNAYPAIGKGGVVPTDWCGFGCTLMGKEALAQCDFTGYDGSGTEDLYINWHRWFPNGIKIAAIAHCPCDHVVRSRSVEGKLVHIHTTHEQEGEYVGHLRQVPRPWYSHSPGEIYNQANNGYLGDDKEDVIDS